MRAAAKAESMAEQGSNVKLKQAQGKQGTADLLASLMERGSLGTGVMVVRD